VAEWSCKVARESSEPLPRDDQLAATVVDAAIEVHRHLGPGFAESVYENALVCELTGREVPHVRQVAICVEYKSHRVGEGRMDLLVDGRLVVEIKALPSLLPIHTSQIISYLKATNLSLGLLLNFGGRRMKEGVRRVVFSR